MSLYIHQTNSGLDFIITSEDEPESNSDSDYQTESQKQLWYPSLLKNLLCKKDSVIPGRAIYSHCPSRGNFKLGNCVLYACRLSKIPRTTKEIADMFRINRNTFHQLKNYFKNI